MVHVFLPFLSRTDTYVNLLGFVGLSVEAFLPVPQILANQRSRSCKGFRLSVLGSWLLGDAMKMSYLFYTKDVIPSAFKMCAMFQACCDFYLASQYWIYSRGKTSDSFRGNNEQRWGAEKDIRLT